MTSAPDVAAPWYLMSKCIGSPAGRLAELQRIVRVVPDHSYAMKDLAAYYLDLQRKDEACELLTRLAEIPKNAAQFEFAQTLAAQNCMRPKATDKQ